MTSGFGVNAQHFGVHEGQFGFVSGNDMRVNNCDSPFTQLE